MMRDVDADDDAASAASSLDDLPGPDEFLATAIQKLALKVTPERASPGGGARGQSGSPAGASRDGSGALQPGDDDAAGSRASSADYDDEEREAVVHFLAAAASPLRRAAPVDGRPADSPKRAMEEMTASLKIEHNVTEAVVEDILDEAEMRAAYPAASGSFVPFEAPETPMETAPTSPSPSVGANLHLLQDAEHTRSLHERALRERLGAGDGGDAEAYAELESYREKERTAADRAMRAARARLSDALRAVASSLVSCSGDPARSDPARSGAFSCSSEGELDPDAAEVAEAIASVWQACDAASAALASAMEARDASEGSLEGALEGALSDAPPPPTTTTGHANANTAVSVSRGGVKAAAKRAMLEEAVFSAWMQSGDTSSNLMFSEEPLPTAETWPLSPGGGNGDGSAAAARFAAAAADAAEDASSSPNVYPNAASPKPGGRDRANRWRAVVSRLALASLRRARGDPGADPDASEEPRAGSDLDRVDTTSTFVPVPVGFDFQNESTAYGGVSILSPASPPRPPSPPFAVRRSRARSSLEWEDLSLIASYMTTTRLLSTALDEWRARAAAAKARRRAARERRRAAAMAERERSRVAFARGALLGWRDACRALSRERRARYGSVSRASIRKLTRSPLDRVSPSSASRGTGASSGAGAKTAYGFGSADRGWASGAAGRRGGDSPRSAPPPLKLFRTGVKHGRVES